jgi:hypothetical protein
LTPVERGSIDRSVLRTRPRDLAFALLTSLASLAVAACREARDRAVVGPVPDAERVVSTPPPPVPSKAQLVAATVRRWLAVGWGDVYEVDLEGPVRGAATLWVPAGDLPKAGIATGALVSDAELTLELSPIPAPDAGAGGPYVLHVEQRGDGGTAYWGVTRLSLAGR